MMRRPSSRVPATLLVAVLSGGRGEAFDIRDFHDVVLRDGALPLSMPRRRVEAWIESGT
jgi:hypothetical protein